MKQKPEYVKAQENMKPGVITADGFLGHDHRPISEIIEFDEETLAVLHLSVETLIDKMKALTEAGKAGIGEAITVENTWLVRVDETRGQMPSPFNTDGMYNKTNTEVERIAAGPGFGKKIVYNDLIIHLIEKYHFFQGRGSAFRIEPIEAKEILGL